MTRCILVLIMLALAACGVPGSRVPATPTPTGASLAAPLLTATSDPLLPTAPPMITPGPTAAPFPLEAGWWDRSVCYEVFVRSFYDSDGDGIGDLNGLIQKLDYINDGDPASRSDLGANCIWLMPITSAASYHGYDTIDYYRVDPDYGTNDDFKRLVAEAEARGIRVVIDLVLNHTSSQHPWFQAALADPASPYRDWYLWSRGLPRYRGPWGQQVWHPSPVRDEYYYGLFWSEMPDLNYRNPAVTAEAQAISAFWLNEMGAHGFRLDAIKHLIEFKAVQEHTTETHNWLRDYRRFLEQTAPGAYTVGEIFGAGPADLAPYFPDQLDYYFEFALSDQIRFAATWGVADGYLAAVQEALSQIPYQRFAPFLTNHDQNRIASQLGNDRAKARLAAIALLTLPGQPYIYYGEELGMLGVKPDEDLRIPMQWTGEEGAGFTTGRPWRQPQRDYAEKNVAAQETDPDSLLNTYRELVQLHLALPALAEGDLIAMTADNPGVAAFLRVSGDDLALVMINFGVEPVAGLQLALDAQAQLAPGDYRLVPRFGAPEGELTPLPIGPDGAIRGYTPLAVLPAQTGYVFSLSR